MQNLNKVKELIELERENPDKIISREEYNYIRDHKSEYPDWYVGYIGFIYSFGAKFLDSYSGESKGRNYPQEKARNLYRQLPLLKDIKFIQQDYLEINTKGSVVYCDPPYKDYKTSKIYNNNFNTEKFFEWCREQSKYNHIFISESVLPEDFEIVWQDKKAISGLSISKTHSSKPELLGYICNM